MTRKKINLKDQKKLRRQERYEGFKKQHRTEKPWDGNSFDSPITVGLYDSGLGTESEIFELIQKSFAAANLIRLEPTPEEVRREQAYQRMFKRASEVLGVPAHLLQHETGKLVEEDTVVPEVTESTAEAILIYKEMPMTTEYEEALRKWEESDTDEDPPAPPENPIIAYCELDNIELKEISLGQSGMFEVGYTVPKGSDGEEE